jgi:hypothetical protein
MPRQDVMFEGWIDPLGFPVIDQPLAHVGRAEPTLPDILEMLCTPGSEHDINTLIGRWREISKESRGLFIVPNEKAFLERLIWPLRHAKSGYVLGNYLGTIALCGVVAEMLAVLLYDITTVSLAGEPISRQQESLLFGSKFEKLRQERRTQVLLVMRQIDNEVKALFDEVRKTRNKYLHIYTQSHDNLAVDAEAIFNQTVQLIVRALGFGLSGDGRFTMRPDLLQYMRERGIVTDVVKAEKALSEEQSAG